MYLKSIRANGFKSFADKIEINVNDGITGIVGPNGSGKSNVLDAIRWVMGEQSVKALRGDTSMTDVIFAGSKSRSASKRASVSLTFDNTDHYLHTDFNEIELKRVVYASGENEYFINNVRVRLKDITDLFLDSGAGKEAFNIISQGAVVDIVNSKPEDRRMIIESAAGVLKYKKRKEESFRKLEKTNENLARVHLLIDELLNTLNPLKEEAEKAKRYLELKENLESIEIALLATDIETLNQEYLATKGKVTHLLGEVEELDLSNTSDSSALEALKLESLKLDTTIEEKNSALLKITNELADLQSQKQITMERQKYEVDNDALKKNVAHLQEEVLRLENEILSLKSDCEKQKQDIETKELEQMELQKKWQEKKEQQQELRISCQGLEKDIFLLQNKIEYHNNELQNNSKMPIAVKSVLNNIRLKGIHNVLYKLLTMDTKYALAIETSLGANNNVLVVENEESAKEAITYLKEQKLGRATFFPLSVIKRRTIPKEDLDLVNGIKGFLGVASDLVSYEYTYEDIILNQLGNVLVADTIDTLNEMGRILQHRYKIVSLDGEILYAGGAITGGRQNKSNSISSIKQEIETFTTTKIEKEQELASKEEKRKKLEEEMNVLSEKVEEKQRALIKEQETYQIKKNHLQAKQKEYKENQEEIKGTENVLGNSLDQELESILKEYYEVSREKEKLEKDLLTVKGQKSDLGTRIAEIEKENREMNYRMTQKQNELKNEEIKLGKLDVRIDSLLTSLSENYSMTYEHAHENYMLDMEEGIARQTVNNLKNKMKDLGEVNVGNIKEYERINERYTFLQTQKDDLEVSVTNLLNVITEMDEIMKQRFADTFEKIKFEFQLVFKKLFKGGEGILELTNPNDLLTTGVEIKALPPGKKLNSIALLSGGEKTLTAIALLFAILNVKPVPFVVLDEVEAALDEANVDAFGEYLLSCKERSQFIIITHKKKTMEYADCLYGITMQESGVSKLVSVKLED